MIYHGVLAYVITPTTEDSGLDLESLMRQVADLSTRGVSGVTVLGSSGNFAYLNRRERLQVVHAAVTAAEGRVPVIAGISAVGTREILEHAEDAESAGASGLLLSTVSYLPLSDAEVLQQSQTVAAATSLPLCLYQNYRTTGYEFPLAVVAELSQVPNIVAFKDNAATASIFRQRQEALKVLVSARFSHGLSGDLMIAAGTESTAWHSGPAALIPELYVNLRTALVAGDTQRAASASHVLTELIKAISALPKGGVLHSMARLCGVRTGPPRLPLLPLSSGQERHLATALETAGVLRPHS